MSLLSIAPNFKTPLSADFCPVILGIRNYTQRVKESGKAKPVAVALERDGDSVARLDLEVNADPDFAPNDTILFVERMVKSLLWTYGGSTLHINGPDLVTNAICRMYTAGGEREPDARRMELIFGNPFKVRVVAADEVPIARSKDIRLGGFSNGCRIGFDLGASDYKLAAVDNGRVLFTTEIPWDPSVQKDPQYHIRHIREGLKLAASHLTRVDAIGGSAAGAYIRNEVRYASLFRSIPSGLFEEWIKPLFHNLAKEWNVPLQVMNDGEVTALAGSMSMDMPSLLGIAMGSSEAAGYVNERSAFTGDYHELAYVPVDNHPRAPLEPISKDRGCGAQYFSQQAVARLATNAGFEFPHDEPLPSRLLSIQQHADEGNPKALDIFNTIGTYLGYTLPWYQKLIPFKHALILGRVTSGSGGLAIINNTRQILKHEFPDSEIEIHVPDERMRRVGQAVAAASLPQIN
jgi:predicted NBD/HSP70 family sugar kinase